MESFFRTSEPDQALLMPGSPREWLPEGHLAHFISDTVDQLDLAAFYERYLKREHEKGEKAYHPRMLLKVLIYGYCVGVVSSRKIAGAIEELVPLRYLAAGNAPNHRTIARFREQNHGHFNSIFAQVVEVARESNLITLGTLAVDGTRVKANASKHKAMSYGRMQAASKKLRQEIRKIVRLAQATDKAEDEQFGPDFRGDELPEELRSRKARLAKIKEAMKRLEKKQDEEDSDSGRGTGDRGPKLKRANGVPPDKAQTNFTDPESAIMKTASKSFEQCYNGQIAVDAKEKIVVAADVTACAADVDQLVPMVEAAERNTGLQAKRVLADAGYKSEANFLALERKGTEGYVALRKGETAPQGSASMQPATARMKRRLATKSGRRRYKLRKTVAEPPLGWIKRILGFRSFSLRGLAKVRGEWNLVCLAGNLRRMNGMIAWR